jgi:uncharacterized membrane protein (DUF4010 family)
MLSPDALMAIAVAAGCGMLIGTDRERRKGSGPARGFAGLRTFTLASLTGALSHALGGGLALAGAGLVAALAAISYWRDRSDDPGVTTELALFLSFLLGVAAIGNPAFAAGAAVVIAALLHLRSSLHRFVRVSLTRAELRDALVVRPLLPDLGHPWLFGVNPRALWTLAVLIMGIQAGAHIGLRLAGPRLGFALSGLAAGFISSVATTTAMGARCRTEPQLRTACVCGALLSSIATFALLWVVALTVAAAQLRQAAPVLGGGLLAALVVGAVSLRGQGGAAPAVPSAGRVFDIRQAALFAAALTGATMGLGYLNASLGEGALLAGTALAGFFDVHAASGSALSLLASGKADARDAMLAVLLAVSANTLSKCAGALVGGREFALRVIGGLLLILLAAWLPFWLFAA